jgi:glycosyltransferase involved in cell wall biosynthesis
MKISQTMIVRNEEQFIERALTWGKEIFFEQIVVDTGSTDKTVEIAEKLGARVYHFDWIDDFAAARNYASSFCSGDWIVQTDADEYIESEDVPKIEKLMRELPPDIAQIRLGWVNLSQDGQQVASYEKQDYRIYRNSPKIKFYTPIHEYIQTPQDMKIYYSDINLMHTSVSTPFKRRQYMSILEKSDTNIVPEGAWEQSDFFNRKYHLASEYCKLTFKDGKFNQKYETKALELYNFILDKCPKAIAFKRSLTYYDMRKFYFMLNRKEDAFEITKRGYEELPNIAFMCITRGIDLYREGDHMQAFNILRRAETICQNRKLVRDQFMPGGLEVSLYEYLIKISEAHATDIVSIYYVKLLRLDKNRTDILRKLLALSFNLDSEEDVEMLKKAF